MSRRPAPDRAPAVLLLGLGWDRPGGVNRYVQDLHRALGEPPAVVLGPAETAPPSVTAAAGESDPLLTRLVRYSHAVQSRVGPGSVLDAHFAMLAALPTSLGRARRAPLVVHFHGPWADESVASGESRVAVLRAKRRLERLVYHRASRLVVLSEAFRDLVVERYGVDRDRVRVVPPGVDLERFAPAPGARSRIGLPPEERVTFAARRLVPRMGLDVLLEAWRQLGDEAGLLVVAGEGPARAALEAQAVECGLSGRVRFVGRVDEETLVDHYRAADLCVLPSLALEGFGLAALEALACGTPVVVTDVGGLPEVVRGLDVGLVVPAGDAAALARRLAAALAGVVPDARACRSHAETFTWDRAAATHREIYREVLDEAGGRRGDGPRRWRRVRGAAAARSGQGGPRVVYLDHSAQLSGAEIALLRLLPALDGVEPHVVLAEDGPLRTRLEALGYPVDVLALDPTTRALSRSAVGYGPSLSAAVHSLRYVWLLRRRLRELRPDLVHANSLKAALYGSLAGRLAGVPVVWHARDRVAADYLPARAVRLVRLVARLLPAAVLANSRSTLESLDLPASRLSVVVADPYRPPDTRGRRPEQEVTRPLRVGVVGRLSPWKGQHVFLEALARVAVRREVTGVLVGAALFGEDRYAEELRSLAARLGLQDRVEFRGFVDDVASELEGLDVLVHASVIPEPFGQVVVEGMAAGLPVVATAAGGPLDVIRDGVDGILVPPGDVERLAQVLAQLLDDPARREQLGEAARASAAAYDPSVIGPRVTALYHRVLQQEAV